MLLFDAKAPQPMHFVEEVHNGAIRKIHHGVGTNLCSEVTAEGEDPYVLSRGQINPDIGVQRGRWDALKNGSAHPDYLKPYFLRAERVNKSCERRKLSCRRHRWSGVAARLRANRNFSSSLSPRTRRMRRRTLEIFFHLPTVSLGSKRVESKGTSNHRAHG